MPNHSQRRKASKKRIAARVGVLVLSVLLICVSGGFIYIHSLLNTIDRSEITGVSSISASEMQEFMEPVSLSPGETVPDSVQDIKDTKAQYEAIQSVDKFHHKEIKNILLIGSDSRGTNDMGRSDSIMLMSINTSTQKIHLVSFMRTMYVNIPGKMWFALNTAYFFGGPDLLIETIENNFRVEIDDYMIINFSSFESMIDLVGGIDIELTSAEAKYLNNLRGTNFNAGVNHLNGTLALDYARIRKIDTDFHRTGRQRLVMEILLEQVLHSNVGTLNRFAQEMLPQINTSMSNSEILDYVLHVGEYTNYEIDEMMLPIENQPDVAEENGGYQGMMYVNYGGIAYEVWKVDYYTNVTALHERLIS